MMAASQRAGAAPQRPGIIERLVKAVFLHSAAVIGIDDVAKDYRLVEIGGEALKGLTWVPGQQVQIGAGRKMTNRAYTPIECYEDRAVPVARLSPLGDAGMPLDTRRAAGPVMRHHEPEAFARTGRR
jgi:hypothetical protein